eukprot:CAMPEP_0114625546 /NCGR_PEP_ID=MMETSP0168-20121206/11325_1 /TAXON_ID=95228 ORGANISM="Vannella sp., Strain DIVA3 517/6/12" /NCGR_SAMPLE_ID=MMETSP0168 /ASSEMBLY_ACC=CAM_ASM_000044 /LENGTH=374 /DNA_ID=CAMNT_0001836829 /DNA_START=88 /DNA_END=1212 /DNA_ORIENTATION=+
MEGVLIQSQSTPAEKEAFERWSKAILGLCANGKKPCLAFDCEGINLGFSSGTLELMMLALVGTNCSMSMNANFEQRPEDSDLFRRSFLIDLGCEADVASVELLRCLFAQDALHLCGWGLRNDIAAILGAFQNPLERWTSTPGAPQPLVGRPIELKCHLADMQLFTLQDVHVPPEGMAYAMRVRGLAWICKTLGVQEADAEAKKQIQKNIRRRVVVHQSFGPWFPRPIDPEAIQYQTGDIQMIRTVAERLDEDPSKRYGKPWETVAIRTQKMVDQIAAQQPMQFSIVHDVQRRYFNRYSRHDAVFDGTDADFHSHIDNLQCQVTEDAKVDNLAMIYDRLMKATHILENAQENELLALRCASLRARALPLLQQQQL